tara:strand:- start:50 stop:754 length:705 start_codon:yes stop_codon:yes gene_type:complete
MVQELLEILFEISYVFLGFISGVYFEKFNESKKDNAWRIQALESIKFDLETDHGLFKETIEADKEQIIQDRKIFDKININTPIHDFFSLLDELNDNTEFDSHFGNLTDEDYDFIDLNRVNYDAFLKYGNKDSVDDNELKGYLDWIFEGLTFLYRTEIANMQKAKRELNKFCAEIGYSFDFKKPIKERYSEVFIIHFKALYSNYLIDRENHIKIKNKMIRSLEIIPKKIEKILKK